jgi:hypothetical protein
MLDERTLYLINGGLDGELDAAEREELAHILADSAEARELQAVFQRLGNVLDSQPALPAPPGLRQRILDQLPLPPQESIFSLRRVFESIQPATMGLSFAAGLFATVAFYELTNRPGMTTDTTSMVGTMMSGQQDARHQQLDSLTIREAGLDGKVSLTQREQFLILSFDLDSREFVEVEISYAKAGLDFGGLAHTPIGNQPVSESYVISGGTLRVENQGRQAFSVFLPMAASNNGGGRAIDIAIYSDGAQRFSGVIQG